MFLVQSFLVNTRHLKALDHAKALHVRSGNRFASKKSIVSSSSKYCFHSRSITSSSHIKSISKESSIFFQTQTNDSKPDFPPFSLEYFEDPNEFMSFVPGSIFKEAHKVTSEFETTSETSAGDILAQLNRKPTKTSEVVQSMSVYERVKKWSNIELLWREYFCDEVDQDGKIINQAQFVPNSSAYRLILRSLRYQSGKSIYAESIFEEMQKRGIKPTVFDYSNLLGAVSHSGEPNRTLKIYQKMISSGTKPNLYCMSILLDVFINYGSTSKVLEIIEDTLNTASTSQDVNQPKQQNQKETEDLNDIYGQIIQFSMKIGDMQKATEYFNKIIPPNQQESLNVGLKQQTPYSKEENKLQQKQQEKKNLKASKNQKKNVASNQTSNQSTLKKSSNQKSNQTSNQSKSAKSSNQSSNRSSNQSTLTKSSNQSNQLLNEPQNNQLSNQNNQSETILLSLKTLMILVNYCRAIGDFAKTHKILGSIIVSSQLHSQGTNGVPFKLSHVLLELTITSKGAIESRPLFDSLLPTLPLQGIPGLYLIMLRAYAKEKLYDQTLELFQEFENQYKNDLFLTPFYNFLMEVYIDMDRCDDALSILGRMQSDQIHQPDQSTSANLILLTCIQHGPEQAQELLQSLLNHEQLNRPHPKAYLNIIEGYCKQNKADSALKLIEMMKSNGLQVSATHYTPIMNVYGRLGLVGKQYTLYKQLEEMGLHPDANIMTKLIQSAMDRGYLKLAHALANDIDRLKVSLSPHLLYTLIRLSYARKNMSKVIEYSKIAMEGLKSYSIDQRIGFSHAALLACAYSQPHNIAKVFEEIKSSNIPLTLRTFAIMLHVYVITEQVGKAKHLWDQKQEIFGNKVAKQALSHPFTINNYLRLLHLSKKRKLAWQLWEKILQQSRESNNNSDDQGLQELLEQSFMDAGQSLPKGYESNDHQTNAESYNDDGLGFSSEDEADYKVTGDAKAAEGSSDSQKSDLPAEFRDWRPPKMTLSMLQTMTIAAQNEKDPDTMLKLVQIHKDAAGIPSRIMLTLEANAYAAQGDVDGCLNLLKSMQAQKILLTEDMLVGILHQFSVNQDFLGASLVFKFMAQNVQMTHLPVTTDHYNLLFKSVEPARVMLVLEGMDAYSLTPNARTLQAMLTNLLQNQTPLDKALNNSFYLCDFFRNNHQIHPTNETLSLLARQVGKKKIQAKWKAYYFDIFAETLNAKIPGRVDAHLIKSTLALIESFDPSKYPAFEHFSKNPNFKGRLDNDQWQDWMKDVVAFSKNFPPLTPLKIEGLIKNNLCFEATRAGKEKEVSTKRATTSTSIKTSQSIVEEIMHKRQTPSPNKHTKSPFGRPIGGML